MRLGESALAKVGPNEPCWCGSGKKYKRCHRKMDEWKRAQEMALPVGRAPGGRSTVQPGRISPRRPVPESIPRPDYAASGVPAAHPGKHFLRTADQEARMRRATRVAAEVLSHVVATVRPGMTTDELDAVAHTEILRLGAYPSPLNYHGYPKSICTSVNEVICHGIPDDRALQEGDIVNCDVTVYLEGMHGDCSAMVTVGQVSGEARRLVDVTRECLLRGIAAVHPGGRVSDIGRAIEAHAKQAGFSVVRAFVGHGIGDGFHMEPQVPHFYDPGCRERLEAGMTFTIEPMINTGSWRHVMWDDEWTAVTEDLGLSAQFEHTVLVTGKGVEILTLPPGAGQPFEH